ncbi:hypothetical protein HYE23_01890 [Mycoplasmopsis bovis]|nr:hypothetical protein [Mycoplasmopsis bovis]QQH23894.1 hypothetical protein HYE23_01890 [Mycoplasmopsis bovis]
MVGNEIEPGLDFLKGEDCVVVLGFCFWGFCLGLVWVFLGVVCNVFVEEMGFG